MQILGRILEVEPIPANPDYLRLLELAHRFDRVQQTYEDAYHYGETGAPTDPSNPLAPCSLGLKELPEDDPRAVAIMEQRYKLVGTLRLELNNIIDAIVASPYISYLDDIQREEIRYALLNYKRPDWQK